MARAFREILMPNRVKTRSRRENATPFQAGLPSFHHHPSLQTYLEREHQAFPTFIPTISHVYLAISRSFIPWSSRHPKEPNPSSLARSSLALTSTTQYKQFTLPTVPRLLSSSLVQGMSKRPSYAPAQISLEATSRASQHGLTWVTAFEADECCSRMAVKGSTRRTGFGT